MKKSSPTGFTLVELMIAMTVGVLVIGLTMESFINLYKSMCSGWAYCTIHQDARSSLDWMSRDMRASTGVVAWISNDITVVSLDSTGGTANIRYMLNSNQLLRIYTLGSTSTNKLTHNTVALTFQLYNKAGGLTTTPANTYEIRTYMQISNVSSYQTVGDLLQTRIRMRNKP